MTTAEGRRRLARIIRQGQFAIRERDKLKERFDRLYAEFQRVKPTITEAELAPLQAELDIIHVRYARAERVFAAALAKLNALREEFSRGHN